MEISKEEAFPMVKKNCERKRKMEENLKQIIKCLREFSVPELCDGARFYRTMDYRIKPMAAYKKIVGPALTVHPAPGESSTVVKALEQVVEGQVIVIAAGGCCSSSFWGDHRSICARFMKAEGVVIDGAFRDVEGCEKAGFPVYAMALTPGAAGKSGTGAVNVPVSCGGVPVNPGDLIIGDQNGVCVICPDEAEAVMERARRKIEAQERTVQEMRRTGKVMPRIMY